MRARDRRAARPTAILALLVVTATSLSGCGGGDGDAAPAGGGDSGGRTVPEATDPTGGGDATSPLPAGGGNDDDAIEFVTTPPATSTSTTTSTTVPPTTSTTTTTTLPPTTTTTSTTTTSTSTTTTTSTVPPATTVRCSFAADALFEPGAYVLTDDAVDELARLQSEVGADVLSVLIEGRTDHRGTDQDNLDLSEDRAQAAADALVDAGMDPDVITVSGLGEADAHQPAGNRQPTDAQMAADRRVDITVEADVPITARC